MPILTAQACRAARALLDWSPMKLAREAGLSLATVRQVEAGGAFDPQVEAKLKTAFAAHDVEITNGDGTGVRLLFGKGPA